TLTLPSQSGTLALVGAGSGFATTSTVTLGSRDYLVFNGTTEQNNWSTIAYDLARTSVTGTDSLLMADVYSGGRTIVSLDSTNNYCGKLVLEPGAYPKCHLFMRDSTN